MSKYLHATFPDDFVSNAEKNELEYGRIAGEAINVQWFNGQLTKRRHWIDKMRSYGKGEQTTNYQEMIEGKKDQKIESPELKSQKNYKIDYREKIRVLPVFKDILSNAIDESNFKPRAEAIDTTAINKKKDYFENLENDFYTQDLSRTISEGIGVDIVPSNLPKDEKDLNIRKLDYKPRIEIAQELAIENVFKHQKFEAIKDKVDEDLIDLGIGVVWHHTDYREGIKMEYVDPYNFIHSPFETDDGRDIRYKGVAKKDTIGNLLKLSSRTLSEDELLKLKQQALGSSENVTPYDDELDSERIVEFVVFEYSVYKSRIFKKLRKNRTVKLIDRSKDGYNTSNPKKRIDIPYKVWYEGIYVPSADLILKWEEIPNQVEKEINQPVSNFVVYAPKVKRLSEKGDVRFNSIIQRAIPLVDDLHRDWYKFQQLKMELRPNTAVISPTALNRVTLNGKKIAPQDVLDLFFGRGILLADEFDEDGDPIGRSIREENGGVNNNAIVLLSNEFTNTYNRIRQVIGVNELRDGTTTPNSKTAVTVQKILLASSNTATSHIVKGSFNISLRMSEVISLRLYDVLSTTALKERYVNIIGSDNVDLLDEIKALPMHKFAIYFDFEPDNDERNVLEQSLIDAYGQREINVAQYNRCRQIRNTKSALKYLEYAVEENRIRTEEEKVRNIRIQSEANAQSAVVAEQAKQQTITIQFETQQQLLIVKSKLEDESKRKQAFTQELLDQRKHERAMELKRLEVQSLQNRETTREDRRDERVRMQSEDQAVLIEKRKNPSKEVNFEQGKSDFEKELNEVYKSNGLPPS